MDHVIQISYMGVGETRNWLNDRYTLIDRIYFIHSGEGFYTLNGKTNRFLPGHTYYLPWTAEYTLFQNEDAPMNHTYVSFSGTASLFGTDVIDFRTEDNPHFAPIVTMIQSMIRLGAVEHHPGFAFIRESGTYYPTIMNAAIIQLLELISRTYGIYQTYAPDIHRALIYIHANYREPITVETLASVACLNPHYFIRKFTQVVHITPSLYLRNLRCDIAMSLIGNGVPIASAAEQAGFASPSALYRILRNHKRQ